MKRRFPVFLLALVTLSSGGPVFADGIGRPDGGGDMVRIPGLPTIGMPPVVDHSAGGEGAATDDGGDPDDGPRERRDIFRDFGNGVPPGFQRGGGFGQRLRGTGDADASRRAATPPKPKAPTAEERAAAIRKALAPRPPLAVLRRRTLDDLYAKLAVATDADEAKGLASLIGNIWMRSGSDTANLLMQRAVQAIGAKDDTLALKLLDRIVVLQPDWAEAWNKRASVRYFSGDIDGSMADVEHVLKLEPKHFGALEGMATMLEHAGMDKRALQIYRRALAVYPHQPELEKTVDRLTLEVEGQGI